jgi:aminopeptidase
LTDTRIQKLARILVEHSTKVKPGDRVAIESVTSAEPLVREIYRQVLERGGYPHILLHLPDEDEIFFAHAKDDQLDFTPTFQKTVAEEFEVYIRARSDMNTRALSNVDPARQARLQKAVAPVRNMLMKRGGDKSLQWVLTQFPTQAFAMEAEMGIQEYENFVYKACHADEGTPDPVAFWEGIEREQARIVERIEGQDRVELRGPNVDLSLSIKGRKFRNSSGQHNMPDGEIYTGPVEDSVNGWVKYNYPAVTQGRVVEGIELQFEKGRVVKASAEKNEEFLLKMLDADEGARYVGEFAIGTNFEINRFTRNILFDEKIGGTFHMALGAGYPETGSKNTSVIHWDMIGGLQEDAEIRLDGEVIYRNGSFLF